MKSFKTFREEKHLKNLFEATDLSTAMETVIGICYQAASAGGKKGKDILLDAMANNKEFKKANSVWDKGKEEDSIKGLMKFGKNVSDVVQGDGTYQIQAKGKLTSQWSEWANKKGSDTSKTDIVIGGYKYSVKNADGAQLMSGKKGESIATANAAARTAKIDAVKTLTDSMSKLEEATTKGYYASVKVMKRFRDTNPRATDSMQKWAEKEVKRWEKLKKQLEKEKNPKKAAILKKSIKAANPSKEMKQMATAKGKANAKLAPTYIAKENKKLLKNMDTVFKDNQEEVKKKLKALFKKNELFKLGFVYEAASGSQKFGKSAVQTAEYMFVWKPKGMVEDFLIKEHEIKGPTSKTIKEYADQVNIDVNWKGSSTSNQLGYNIYQNVRLCVKEVQFESNDLFENYIKQYDIYQNYLEENAITEGAFFDRIKSLATKLMDGIKKVWNKFVGIIKEAISKIKEYADAGIMALGNMFGLEMDVQDNILNKNNLTLTI